MHAPWLTIHELAKALKVSIKTVRRAYLRGEIPVERIFRFVRFDLEQVKEAMRRNAQADLDQVRQAIQRNGHGSLGIVDAKEGATPRATGGASRRRDGVPSPRLVKRGRKFQPSTRRSV
ncbi:MAG: helix-turn-helix domain-containing protein [Nitrospira sp.]|nr:helix-turn-helix domain-containing protein [Nitrospira sp.]MDH4245232.1 helix-turn-helix domain-containing protein [Nitrospira sp.]MDH4357119.1 helix-turn-helix domain-containing protein [Nitrospira sp.]MDH5318165.1 helix-turn-helix domain-containing protein [Nitrospira sp.]